ncbi:hypothetical protein IOC57_23380 [Bacillus sp. SD075]|uniref:4-hydroxyphenylacetate 3-hydroxylase C-terminal domain-containing protein n=1 Tax=Bacillus sp. SD075 TaxID=2781732 RepID=UPI001A9700D7|nr:4-hydroxyphenylacetate 3-hydroxylase C-terminal domain-containing protein [Bacillus sp. SD075]MBO1000671.1 hypothetical protein [Bacillus sp. SD075]
MSKSKEGIYLERVQDGRKIRGGGKIIGKGAYLNEFRDLLYPIASFLNENHTYSALTLPSNIPELEKEKYQLLSYEFPEGPLFSEGWTDLAHSYLKGWFINRGVIESKYPGFSDCISELLNRLNEECSLVTIPYEIALNGSLDVNSVKVVETTDLGLVLQGTQQLPADALAVKELLTMVGNEEKAALIILPLNSEGLSLEVEDIDKGISAHFNHVTVKWNQVLLQQSSEKITQLFAVPLATTYPEYTGIVTLFHQLEWVTGLAFLLAEETGESEMLHIQERLGELIQQIDIMKAFLHQSELKSKRVAEVLVPQYEALRTVKHASVSFFGRAIDILQRVGGSRLLHHVHVSGTQGKEKDIYTLIQTYFDSPAASRRRLYYSYFSGDPELVSAEYYKSYSVESVKGRLEDFWEYHETGNMHTAIPKGEKI